MAHIPPRQSPCQLYFCVLNSVSDFHSPLFRGGDEGEGDGSVEGRGYLVGIIRETNWLSGKEVV